MSMKSLDSGQKVFIKSLNKWKRIYSPDFKTKVGDNKLYVSGYIIKIGDDKISQKLNHRQEKFQFFEREDLLTEEQYKFTLL